MATAIYTNNATSKLASAIGTGDTSIPVTATEGALFPSPSGGDWFPVTVVDSSGNYEIMKCTARSSDTLTVTRAQEGTTAKAFASGDVIDLRITAAALGTKADGDDYLPIAGGVVAQNFESTGIDDNATSTQVTVIDTGTGFGGSPTERIEAHHNTSSGGYISSNLNDNTVASGNKAGFLIKELGVDKVEFDYVRDGSATARINYSDNFKFQKSGVDQLTIDANSDVVTQGTLKLSDGTDISMSSAGAGQIQIDGNGYNGAIALDATGMHIYQNSSARVLSFGVNETTVGYFDTTGLIIPSGLGLYLGGTAAANQLDDYEEGTWTPTMAWAVQTTAPTFTFSNARYVKIGQMVFVQAYITVLTVGTGNSGLDIGGLPFANGYAYCLVPLWSSNATSALGGYLNAAGTTIRVARLDGSSSNLDQSELGGELGICFAYMVSA